MGGWGPTIGVGLLLRCEGGATSGIGVSSMVASADREPWTRDAGAEARLGSGSWSRHGHKRLCSIMFNGFFGTRMGNQSTVHRRWHCLCPKLKPFS
jgi:hypothetical protein